MENEEVEDALVSRRAALRTGAMGAGVLGAVWLVPSVTAVGLGGVQSASAAPDRVSPRGPGTNRSVNSGNNPGLGHR